MAERWTRPYLDAMCWITALTGAGPYKDDLREVLRAADRTQIVLVASVLMPLESSAALATSALRRVRRTS